MTPFGLSLAPKLFTRVVFSLVAWLHGVCIHAYLDDLLIMAESQCLDALTLTIQVLVRVGFTINLKKFDLRPCVHWGLSENGPRQSLSARRMEGGSNPGDHKVQSCGCEAPSLSLAPNTGTDGGHHHHSPVYARLRMRPIQWHLIDSWVSGEFSERIMVTSQLLPYLLWWT